MLITKKSTTENLVFSNNGYSSSSFKCLVINAKSFVYAYSEDLKFIKDLGFIEYKDYGLFVNEKMYKGSIDFVKVNLQQLRRAKYSEFNNIYKLKSLPSHRNRNMRLGVLSPTHTITEGKRYTFGIELETCSGKLPIFSYKDLNLKSTYDGSIKSNDGVKAYGGEYVTGVLTGDYGFFHLNKITEALSRYTMVNKTCSVHVHIGGFHFNKENIVFLWDIFKNLEDEIFSLMPKSRRSSPYCNRMNNNGYNIKPDKFDYYNSINKSYTNIVKIVSLGSEPNQIINKRTNHPAGRVCGYNKSTPRYWWVNFVPSLFSISGITNHTIEMRIHSASTNYIKIRNFILLFMAIVYFAENAKTIVMNGDYDLYSIIRYAYPNKGDYLVEYYKERKEFFDGKRISSTTSENSEYKLDSLDNVRNVIKNKELL